MAKRIVDLTPPHPAFVRQAGKGPQRRKGDNADAFRAGYDKIDWSKKEED